MQVYLATEKLYHEKLLPIYKPKDQEQSKVSTFFCLLYPFNDKIGNVIEVSE